MFWTYFVGTLFAVIAVLIYVKVKKQLSYFQERGMPYLKPKLNSVLGFMHMSYFFDESNEAYEKTKGQGDYVGFFPVPLMPLLLITDASLVQDVHIKDFNHFQDHGFEQDPKYNPLLGHLFNMKGDEWRTMRHKLLPVFTSGKLKGMLPVIEGCADRLILEMKENSELRDDTNMKDLFSEYTLSVTAKCAFGLDFKDSRRKDTTFHKIIDIILRPSFIEICKLMLISLAPRLASFLRITFYPKHVNDFFFDLTRDTFRIRQDPAMRKNDFIQTLLELKQKGKVDVDSRDLEEDERRAIETFQPDKTATQLELTDELLTAQVFVFLVAGFENTAYLLAITSYVLSKHPEIQRDVREEVRSAMSKHGEINYLALRDMKLLGACIDEALRLYPSLIVSTRECTKPYTLKDGNVVEKGTVLVTPVSSIQRDSRYWDEPLKFDPQRFLTQGKILPGTYLPFGDGPRICIAQRLALIMTKMMMIKLLDNFEILPSVKTQEPVKIYVTMSADILGGSWANFKPLHT